MKPKFNDISGQVFGNLKVVKLDPDYIKYPQRYIVECSCGVIFSTIAYPLTSGQRVNCRECSIRKTRKASDEQLIELYNKHKNIWKVADEIGMCGQSVNERLIKLGVQESINYFTDDDNYFLKKNYEDYATRGRLDELAKIMKRTKNIICRQAKKLGLNTRYGRKKRLFDDFDNRFKKPDMYKNREHPRGMAGKKHKPEVLEKLSQISKENQAKINADPDKRAAIVKKMIETKHQKGNLINPRQKQTWKAGWREIGGKRKYFRSKWEANYARYLEFLKTNKQIKDWEHEARVFWFEGIKRGCVSFLPDFQIEENSGELTYHEVKGWMDERSKTKIKRMSIYFPQVKLTVIDAAWFKSNNRTLMSIIYGWET
jgi:hypothetical protein